MKAYSTCKKVYQFKNPNLKTARMNPVKCATKRRKVLFTVDRTAFYNKCISTEGKKAFKKESRKMFKRNLHKVAALTLAGIMTLSL